MATAVTFAPRGWAMCNGQLMSIAQNSALFALLGTNYGGDGQTTFGLPDLRGRMVVGAGSGPGLSTRTQGDKAGGESSVGTGTVNGSVTVTSANMPSHTHTAAVTSTLAVATVLQTSSTGGGSVTPVAGAGLTAALAGPSGAAIYMSPAPTTGLVDMGNITSTLSGAVTVANSDTGGGAPIPFSGNTSVTTATMSPFTVLNYIIATEGIFPSRN
ncbi:MAG: tail fiber protein [Pseudomonadota bacterium]